MNKRTTYWPQVIGILLVYLIACMVEPCDGHGCAKQQVTYAR